MSKITKQTRSESYEKVDKQRRYNQIFEVLNELGSASAREISEMMHKKGYTPTSERNFSAPRLTELVKFEKLEIVGKKVCEFTGKKVAVYKKA